GIIRVPQGHGDLGCRMQRILEMLPPGPVAIIGSDIPGVTSARIAPAFRSLGRNHAVFGRALDGGYWLIGLRRRPRVPRIFAKVRWSSEHALGDTLAGLSGLAVAFVAPLADVDAASAYSAASTEFGRGVLSRRGPGGPPRQVPAPG